MKILSLVEKKPERTKSSDLMHVVSMVYVEPNIETLASKLKLGTLMTLVQPLAESIIYILSISHKVFKQHKTSQTTISDTKGIWL